MHRAVGLDPLVNLGHRRLRSDGENRCEEGDRNRACVHGRVTMRRMTPPVNRERPQAFYYDVMAKSRWRRHAATSSPRSVSSLKALARSTSLGTYTRPRVRQGRRRCQAGRTQGSHRSRRRKSATVGDRRCGSPVSDAARCRACWPRKTRSPEIFPSPRSPFQKTQMTAGIKSTSMPICAMQSTSKTAVRIPANGTPATAKPIPPSAA